MSDEPQVWVDQPNDGITRITLNRPARLNALSFSLVDDLHAALDAAHRDNDCRVVILAGAGRGFCSGLDLASIEGASTARGTTGPRSGMLSQEHIAELVLRIARLQQPVIAAVNGVAYGGGFALALAADIRFASTSARFCSQFIKLGLGGCDIGVSYTLPRLVGASLAAELLLTARTVDADEARRVGLVADVVPDEVEATSSAAPEATSSAEPEASTAAGPPITPVVARAIACAELIRAYSPFAVTMTKEVFRANLDAPSFESAIHLENRTQILASTGGEMAEAVSAFLEKRPPDWSRVRGRGGSRTDPAADDA